MLYPPLEVSHEHKQELNICTYVKGFDFIKIFIIVKLPTILGSNYTDDEALMVGEGGKMCSKLRL